MSVGAVVGSGISVAVGARVDVVVGARVGSGVGVVVGARVGAAVCAGEHPSKLSISRTGIQVLTSGLGGIVPIMITSSHMHGDNCRH
jgi:hypothetical protein